MVWLAMYLEVIDWLPQFYTVFIVPGGRKPKTQKNRWEDNVNPNHIIW